MINFGSVISSGRKLKEISIGIKTDGRPELERHNRYTLLRNMLIGDGYHWQRIIEAKLPGEIKIPKRVPENNITLINIVPLEKYLECVVGREMNPTAPHEFLKAHTVISRGWALGKILRVHQSDKTEHVNTPQRILGWDDTSDHEGFDVCSDDHCQRYQGLQEIAPNSLRAIEETAGEVLYTSENKIVDTRFSKCCGGVTEIFSTSWQSKNEECLSSIDDPWCDLSNYNKEERDMILSTILKDYDHSTENYGYRWNCQLSKEDIRENLKIKFGRDIGEIRSIKPLHRGPSGRIDLLQLQGTNGVLEIGKELWIRRLLSPTHLYSSAFEIDDKGKHINLTGKGWGHGVGLCQIGAANMAFNGYGYRDILAFYYPGSRLGSIQ